MGHGFIQIFAVLSVGQGMCLIAFGLASLGQQNQRGGISSLQAERQIQQYKGIGVKFGETRQVKVDPDGDHHRLADQKGWRAEKTGEGFGF
ncbi:hypothetical protein D3C80_681040 [compost metagenome]